MGLGFREKKYIKMGQGRRRESKMEGSGAS